MTKNGSSTDQDCAKYRPAMDQIGYESSTAQEWTNFRPKMDQIWTKNEPSGLQTPHLDQEWTKLDQVQTQQAMEQVQTKNGNVAYHACRKAQ